MVTFEELFGPNRVMVILRGLPTPAQTVAAAERAWDAGVELIEVPIGDLTHVAALAAVVEAAARRGKHVGAGTVITTEHVRAAADAGARYTVAPGLDPTVASTSLAAGLPHMPGVYTPTELQQARAAGHRWVKVFPASTLGPAWFRAIHGPFPDVHLLATGGVSIKAAPDYLDAGAHIVAFGAAATEPTNRVALRKIVAAYS